MSFFVCDIEHQHCSASVLAHCLCQNWKITIFDSLCM